MHTPHGLRDGAFILVVLCLVSVDSTPDSAWSRFRGQLFVGPYVYIKFRQLIGISVTVVITNSIGIYDESQLRTITI
jgi:hypothetical protein